MKLNDALYLIAIELSNVLVLTFVLSHFHWSLFRDESLTAARCKFDSLTVDMQRGGSRFILPDPRLVFN